MKRKGFTLIELLAVIVILAVIALIATPMIMDVIEKSRMGAFKDSVLSAFHQVDYYLVENELGQVPEEGLDVTKIGLQKSQFKYGEFYQREELEVVNISDGRFCAIGGMENLQVFKGECDFTTPRCELRIEGEKGVGEWYNKNPKVVMETSEALTGGLTFGIGKTENYNNEVKQGNIGKAEYQTTETTTTRVYCYVKNVGDNRGSNYIDVKIDQTFLEEATFSYTTTSKSIRVIASGKDQQSGITRYQFSKDNGVTWSEIQQSNSYKFDNLQTGEYPIKVRVYNGTYVDSLKENNLYKESETKVVKTEDLIAPTYEVNPKGWTTGDVKVTIKYGDQGTKLLKTTVNVTSNLSATRCSNVYNGTYTCDGESTKNIEAGVWYLVDSDVELTYGENGSVIAQVVDGVNYKSGSSIVIGTIDKVDPSVYVEVNKKIATFTLEDNSELVGYSVMSQMELPDDWVPISGKQSIVTWEASQAGIYYVYVKDIAGRISYATFEMAQTSFSYEATKSTYAATDIGHKHTGNRNSGGGCYTVQKQSCQTCTITTVELSTSINSDGTYNWIRSTRHSRCGQANSDSSIGRRNYSGSNQVGSSSHSYGCSTYYELGCGKSETTVYTCPNGGTLNGTTCTLYTCPNGGTLSGTICDY